MLPSRQILEFPRAGSLYRYMVACLVELISNFVIDMAILILPVPTVRKLQISWPRKAMLFLAFAQGGL